MKVLSTEGLSKLIQLIKSAFISVDDTETTTEIGTETTTEIDTVSTTEIDTETTSELTLATVATSGSYNDLNNTPDLTTKADIDLSNLNATGKSLASGLGLPSSRYTTLTIGASDTSYTAPANGWFSFTASSPNTSDHDGIYIMNTDAGIGMSTTQIWGRNMYVFAPALSGQKVKVSYVSSITNKTLKFIYAEGEN